jgi:hypothetical protein
MNVRAGSRILPCMRIKYGVRGNGALDIVAGILKISVWPDRCRHAVGVPKITKNTCRQLSINRHSFEIQKRPNSRKRGVNLMCMPKL